jgi:DNA polymerase III alpha subunit
MGLSRTKMAFEYNTYNLLTDKEKLFIKENLSTNISDKSLDQYIQDVIDAKAANSKRLIVLGGIIDTLRKPPYSMEDSYTWVAQTETNLFGIALSATGLEQCYSEATSKIEDYTASPRDEHSIAVTIDDMREIKTKNGKNPGQDMAFITCSDDTGSIDCVIFPDTYKEIRGIIFTGNNIMITGSCGGRKDMTSLIIQKAVQI